MLASERMLGAETTNPGRTEEAAVLDALMLSDGSLVGRNGDDCTQPLQPINELLGNIVASGDAHTENEFAANDRSLCQSLSFPRLEYGELDIVRSAVHWNF